jgi:hypothetical protein
MQIAADTAAPTTRFRDLRDLCGENYFAAASCFMLVWKMASH